MTKKRSKEKEKLKFRKRCLDPLKYNIVLERNRNKNQKKKNQTFEELTDNYELSIKEGPVFACCCCGILKFKKSIVKFCASKVEKFGEEFFSKIHNKSTNTDYICKTCSAYANKGKVPITSLANGLEFPLPLSNVSKLTCLEERLVCPRLPFLRITSLGIDRQKGLRGNIVNVPISTINTVSVLPRSFSNTEVIQLNLVRRLTDKHSYMYETVRPKVVMDALKELVETELYAEEGVSISDTWSSSHSGEHIDFIIDNNENEIIERSFSLLNIDASRNENDDDDQPVNPGGHETLILDQNNIDDIKIAPGEG